MLVIGLTGGIASGKSTTASMIRDRGIPLHDADAAVHAMMAPGGPAVAEVLAVFGEEVAAADGGIDRQRLGGLVFAASPRRAALEAIIHPLVAADRDRFLADQRAAGAPMVVLDVPLLFETVGDQACDFVITIWSPAFIQRQRALRRDGMTPEKLHAIVQAQYPQPDKKQMSDLALPSSLGRAETNRRLRKWLKSAKLL